MCLLKNKIHRHHEELSFSVMYLLLPLLTSDLPATPGTVADICRALWNSVAVKRAPPPGEGVVRHPLFASRPTTPLDLTAVLGTIGLRSMLYGNGLRMIYNFPKTKRKKNTSCLSFRVWLLSLRLLFSLYRLVKIMSFQWYFYGPEILLYSFECLIKGFITFLLYTTIGLTVLSISFKMYLNLLLVY